MSRVKKPAPVRQVEIRWRVHNATHCRVWRTDWGGDQFEVLTNQQTLAVSAMCQRFGISFEEADD